MVYIPTKPVDQETLLNAIRAAVNAAGGCRITKAQFLAHSGMRPRDIYKYFANWAETLAGAGFNFERYNGTIEPERLLADWASVARKLKHLPSRREYAVHGKFHQATFWNNFGPWGKMPGKFRTFAAERPEWEDVLELKPSRRVVSYSKNRRSRARARATLKERIPRRLSGTHSRKTAPRSNGRVICGGRMEIGAFRHAPVNEQGVSMLFAILAERLGYLIEGVRAGFPDCEARKLVGSASPKGCAGTRPAQEAWQGVNIEFEYESRNFRRHGHSPKGCDIIVCWIHNWPECPANLEVIELREEIGKINRRDAEAQRNGR